MPIGVARGREALVVSAVFTSLSTVLTAIRIYTRAFLVRQMGSDDWTIIVSLVSLTRRGEIDECRPLTITSRPLAGDSSVFLLEVCFLSTGWLTELGPMLTLLTETKYLMGEHFLLIPTEIYTKQMMVTKSL